MITVNENRFKSDKDNFESEYRGLHSDSKPTTGVATNALFLELDTGDFYYFDGSNWAKVGG